jgi:hypothetical protein
LGTQPGTYIAGWWRPDSHPGRYGGVDTLTLTAGEDERGSTGDAVAHGAQRFDGDLGSEGDAADIKRQAILWDDLPEIELADMIGPRATMPTAP